MNPELHDRLHKQTSEDGLALDGYPIEASADEILVEENMTTFTEEDVKALVEKAVGEATSELQTKLDEVEAAKKELEMKDTEATISTLNDQIKDLQAKLDTAVLETEAQKTEREELIAYLEAEKASIEREAEVARVRDERTAKVAEVAAFPEDYISANADRWANMSADDFEAAVADYALVSKKEKTEETIPEGTSLKATKESKKSNESARTAIFAMRQDGVDARHVL